MLKRKYLLTGERAYPTFEPLERRELMSVTLPTANTVELQSNVSHVLAEAAKKPKLMAIPSTAGTGLTGEYFSDSQFTTGYELRTDATVKLVPSAKKDAATTVSNSIRWTGQVSPTYSEAYSFNVIANGGVRLWVNGQLLIDQAASSGGNLRSAVKVNLTAGQRYTITLEYTRRSAVGTSVELEWSSLHQKLGVIPQKALFPDASVTLPAVSAGLIGQYYIGQNFNQLVMQRVDPGIDFDFGSKSPTPLIPNGSSFSIRWTGQIIPKYSETYTFTTLSDDGVRLYIDDELLINNWTNHTATKNSAQITLVAGKAYDIRMDYYQYKVVATAELSWSSPSQAQEIVPASALTSTPVATAGGLVATATGSGTIHLTWTGSTSSIGYLIEQSTDGGLTYSTLATTAAGVTDYDVTGLEPATNYTFRVAPVGSSDTSTPSNAMQVGTTTADPSGMTATSTSATTATLSWTDTPGENGYAVYEAPAASSSGLSTQDTSTAGGFTQIGTVAAGVTHFDVTGLSPDTQYQFAVRSLNAAGVLSDLGQIALATTPTLAPAEAPVVTATTNAITITWTDVVGENGFAIDRSLDGTDGWTQIGTTAAGVLSYTDTTIQSGVNYFYRVRSLNAGGTSDPTSIIEAVTTLGSPADLLNSAITAGGTVLNWADVTGEDGFAILESVDGGNTFSQIGITSAGVTTFPVTGLAPGSTYEFAVEALNDAAGASTPGNIVSITTVPVAPAAVVATPLSATSASLTWGDVAGETGFTVQRSLTGISGWNTIATLPTATLTYTDNTLSSGTNYFYRVLANNTGGASAPSISASALTIPSSPVASLTGLSVSQSQVSWGALTGVSQYTIQRSPDGSTNWTTVANSSGSAISTAVANLIPSTVYYYRVIASNASGQSAPSAVVGQMTAPSSIYAADSAIYGATSGANIFELDMTQGTSTAVGELNAGAYCANRSPTNGYVYYFVGASSTPTAYAWDPTTGNNIFTAHDSFGGTPNRTAWNSSGVAFVTDTAGDLYSIVPSPHSVTKIGNLTTLAGTPLVEGPGDMSFSPQGTLYLLNSGQLYTVNTTTAVVTPVGTIGFNATNFVFGQEGLIYATSPTGQQITVNVNTLVSSLVSSNTVPVFTSLTALPEFVNVALTATASANAFTAGVPASYAIDVTNGGPTAADSVSVTVTLGTGVTYSSISGTGWTALPGTVGTTGQEVILTYTGVIGANGYTPPATLNVTIGSSAHIAVATTVSVSDDQFNTAVTGTTTVVTTAVI